jgi:Xaa-Pro aminopeptidase
MRYQPAQAFKDHRKRAYLNPAGADRPLRSPVPVSTLERARDYRKSRIVEQVVRNDCAAILLSDPINIRYALDVSNMQVWALHNAFHYALVFADGHAIDFQSLGAPQLYNGLATVDETRPSKAWIYMYSGADLERAVDLWAADIADCLRARGCANRRLAVDKLDPPGVDALRRVEGQALAETARNIKNADELELMRWSIRVGEAGMARVYERSIAGKTEQEIWAELHYENIRSGGEWLETRLLAAGRRTNPWYQECSDHVVQTGDMLAFDTDMIGPYGYCADLSRSWTIGHIAMNDRQRRTYSAALDQIRHNVELIEPGMEYKEYVERTCSIPEKYVANRYVCALHGVGMSDEYPVVPNRPDAANLVEDRFAEGMVFCVESLIGEEGAGECVKLETQVVVTADGAERLDSFPWEEV